MFVRLLLLLTVVPIVELFVLLQVHGWLAERHGFQTGLLVTIGTILATGAAGALLAKAQGLGVLRGLQRSTAEGRFPARELVDGALVLIGGAMLLTPGFLTDLFGLSLLVPATRALHRRWMTAWLRRRVEQGRASVHVQGWTPGAPGSHEPPGRRVIDVTPDGRDDG